VSWYLTRTVTLVRRQKVGEDDRGNDVYDDVEVPLERCSWNERSSMGAEDVEARQQVISGRMLFCEDPNADVRPTDAIKFPDRDGLYEVDGEVGRETGSRMGNDHMAVALRRVGG
jgi:hypothetical protein